MYYNYLIESKLDSSLYKGFTKNLNKRIKEHNSGHVQSTKNKRPWKIIYYEVCIDKIDAINREEYLKTAAGRRYLKKRLKVFFSHQT